MISLTIRMVLKTAALATTSPAAPFVREGHPARKLSMGFLDRWAPRRRPRYGQAKMIVDCTQSGKPVIDRSTKPCPRSVASRGCEAVDASAAPNRVGMAG
jgi:hypothetical protein